MKYYYYFVWATIIVACSLFIISANQLENRLNQIESTIDEINIEQLDNEIIICVSAKSFLHNQVRSIVGSLKLVGEGKWEPKKIKEILDKKDRTLCGPVSPAEGLCLEKVDYD